MEAAHANEHTFASIPLEMSRGSSRCFGTGFLYLHLAAHYIVTAWHNVSGRNFVDKQPVSPNGWLPDRLNVRIPLKHEPDSEGAWEIGWFRFQTRLYFDHERTRPIWLVHQEQGSRLDIAVIPLVNLLEKDLVEDQTDRDGLAEIVTVLNGSKEPRKCSFRETPTQLLAHSKPDFLNKLEVAQELYVVGYPEAIAATQGAAIWKRGSIASEPALRLRNRPCFLIDSATRPGLSGAPVIGKFANPTWRFKDQGLLTRQGTELGFCGLYTSRLGKNVEGAQLGIVWKIEAIQEVIENGIIGIPSNDVAGLMQEGGNDAIV